MPHYVCSPLILMLVHILNITYPEQIFEEKMILEGLM